MYIYKIKLGDPFSSSDWGWENLCHVTDFTEEEFKDALTKAVRFAKYEGRTLDVNNICEVLCKEYGFTTIEDNTTISYSIDDILDEVGKESR
ncbi:hypothetical protein FT641_18955 [Bacillus paranthracis]|uniref:hypothetical protein n=1 Tax=Bacillus paranthracis TaxID=2026186 RepID=UPI00187950C9|nr:hypothetical protein [Bacillus paranthracis]MBE7114355.1 hypothetical protein [Bacillus paranthracis]MBE7154772.1 hypothetical protein [Bacillus paranthracis]